MLAAFAAATAAAARRRTWIGIAAAVASLVYPFLGVPIAVVAHERVPPILLAAWPPHVAFATATLVLIAWNRIARATGAQRRRYPFGAT